jgi:hypothetical protein
MHHCYNASEFGRVRSENTSRIETDGGCIATAPPSANKSRRSKFRSTHDTAALSAARTPSSVIRPASGRAGHAKRYGTPYCGQERERKEKKLTHGMIDDGGRCVRRVNTSGSGDEIDDPAVA